MSEKKVKKKHNQKLKIIKLKCELKWQSTKCVKLKQFECIRRGVASAKKSHGLQTDAKVVRTQTSRLQVNYFLWFVNDLFWIKKMFQNYFNIFLKKISGMILTSSSPLKQILSTSETKWGKENMKYRYVTTYGSGRQNSSFESSSRTFFYDDFRWFFDEI